MDNTYWNGNGTHEDLAAELQKLIPDSGNCETHKGEVWRAATKIYYDFYNNGFGNTWVKPAEFLMDNIQLDDDVKAVLLEHARGNTIDTYNDSMVAAIEKMIDATVIQLSAQLDRPNTQDMWDYRSTKYYDFAECYNDYEDEYYDEDDVEYWW